MIRQRVGILLVLLACVLVGGRSLHGAGEGWGWGGNGHGQLGDNSTTNRWEPVQVHLLSNLVVIDGGCDFSLASRLDGTVWAWGYNWYGQLGDNTNVEKHEPCSTHITADVITIASAYYHSLALKSNGTVWAWGSNSQGQLGDNSSTNRWEPVQTHNITNIVDIDAGVWHSLALRSDSTVWIWGRNNEGEVGDNTTTNRFEPESTHITPDVIAIAGGAVTSHAIKANGTLWSWGNNNFGQLGIGSSGVNQLLPCSTHIAGVIAVASGDGHTVALKSDGTVWSCGRNNDGQLGIGAAGGNQLVPCSTHIDDVIAVIAGAQHSLAIKSDGTIWAWGRNQNGQLGDNSTTMRPSPVQVHGGAQGGQYLTGINVFAPGGWHSVAIEDAPLAVELTGLDARSLLHAIELQWSDANPAGTLQYIIERGLKEGDDYSEIARIPCNGYTGNSYRDEQVHPGITYYYKLGVVNSNGNTRWYGPVSATARREYGYLHISPNPFTTGTRIEFPGASLEHPVEIKIYDECGRLVKSIKLATSTCQLGTDLKAGLYFVHLKAGDFTEIKKLILVH
jgi:alpha-tubulin suppressor-like RCC1 family protein